MYLSPILFFIYINDLPDNLYCSTKLFANDTNIYRELSDINIDTSLLQSDLDWVSDWAKTWQMSFNPDKCEVMRISHQRDHSIRTYQFFGKSLKVINESKDLGILMSSNLKWGDHVNATVNKANQILDIIKRTVGCSNAAVFSKLYICLIWPVLEYATPVWSPYLVKDIEALESPKKSFKIST